MDQTYMKKENVLKLLITMALPMVISMLVNSLYCRQLLRSTDKRRRDDCYIACVSNAELY